MAKKRKKPVKSPTVGAIIASPEKTAGFFTALQSNLPTKPSTPAEKERLRVYLAQFKKYELQGFMTRALVSIVHHRLPPEVRRDRSSKSRNRRSGAQRR